MPAPLRSVALLAMALTAASEFQSAVAQQMVDFNKPALIRGLLPSVVNIVSTMPGTPKAARARRPRPARTRGSGFVIDPSG